MTVIKQRMSSELVYLDCLGMIAVTLVIFQMTGLNCNTKFTVFYLCFFLDCIAAVY